MQSVVSLIVQLHIMGRPQLLDRHLKTLIERRGANISLCMCVCYMKNQRANILTFYIMPITVQGTCSILGHQEQVTKINNYY